MFKMFTDLKSFITVVTMLLFAYCIIAKVPLDETLKAVVMTVVGFFLGSKVSKKEGE